jgi:chitin-binding protein
LVNGSYEFTVRLPQRTGRHLIYTVWQNTDTPDTYYSCTDVEIAAPVATTTVPRTSASTPRPVPVASSAEQPPSNATRFGMSAVVAALGGLAVLGGILLWRKRIL